MTLPSFGPPTNWIEIPGANDRRDVENFLGRVCKMDESAAVRIVDTGGALRFWARTPFGPMGTRVVVGSASTPDQIVLAHALAMAPDSEGRIDLGYLMPSAWQGMLPPPGGFVQIELVDAQEILDLARRGREVAADESGPLGVAPSLLDQDVISINPDLAGDSTDSDSADAEDGAAGGSEEAAATAVKMHTIFALTGLGFVPARAGTAPAGEKVRVSVRGPWVRLDGRFGSVYHRPESLPLDVL